LRDSIAKSSRQLRAVQRIKPAGITAKERKERRENGMHRGGIANGCPGQIKINFGLKAGDGKIT
jgi:hypothetical protein